MKKMSLISVVFLAVFLAYGATGDILRSQALAGQPANGVRGLAMDWDTGLIWVAGPISTGSISYTTMDPVTMSTGTWMPVASDLQWVFDIGYGYIDGSTKYLLMNDQYSLFTKMIDPTTGAYAGGLPDYYSSANYTDGCAVDWSNNNVYLSSHGDPDVVFYNGTSHSIFASISGAANMGTAMGWGHLFVLRTSTYYTIEVYTIAGTFVQSIPLNSWPSGDYVLGLSCGQVDASGSNESLFLADFMTKRVHEIEVGDYATGLSRTTWGEIKASF